MKVEAGQVAVVTGAANGIGYGLCEALAARGLSLAMADVVDDELERAAHSIARRFDVIVTSHPVDVTDRSQLDDLADQTVQAHGRVDLVCNNAGVVGRFAPVWEFDPRDWEWMVQVNFWGVVHGIRAFVPHLVRQGSGHVVNTASMAGLIVTPGNAIYAATKAAVISISETLAADLLAAGSGVGVTILCPGPTNTRIATEGSRWRPEHLTPEHVVGRLPHVGADVSGLMDVADTVVATLEAVEAGHLYVAPNAGSRARVDSRLTVLLSDVQT
jgi:short-subunit dehydrogenase